MFCCCNKKKKRLERSISGRDEIYFDYPYSFLEVGLRGLGDVSLQNLLQFDNKKQVRARVRNVEDAGTGLGRVVSLKWE